MLEWHGFRNCSSKKGTKVVIHGRGWKVAFFCKACLLYLLMSAVIAPKFDKIEVTDLCKKVYSCLAKEQKMGVGRSHPMMTHSSWRQTSTRSLIHLVTKVSSWSGQKSLVDDLNSSSYVNKLTCSCQASPSPFDTGTCPQHQLFTGQNCGKLNGKSIILFGLVLHQHIIQLIQRVTGQEEFNSPFVIIVSYKVIAWSYILPKSTLHALIFIEIKAWRHVSFQSYILNA